VENLYVKHGPKSLYEMTWEEVEETLAQTDLVLVPVGSVEQHGPHLPLGADALQAEDLCRRVVAKLGEQGVRAVAGPLVPFGVASHHLDFPGTITLSPTTFFNLLKEVCMSLYHHGFRKFVLVLGHGGNLALMHAVAQDVVASTPDAEVIVPNWIKPMTEQYAEILTSKKREAHAGEGETSRMLATVPELVEMERARPYLSEAAERLETKDHPLLGGGIFRGTRSMKQGTPIGSIGDPTLAKAETGERLYSVVVDWLCTVIKAEFPAEA
jgi:creatinine amidohydrolase